jgi:hypothetical protein
MLKKWRARERPRGCGVKRFVVVTMQCAPLNKMPMH